MAHGRQRPRSTKAVPIRMGPFFSNAPRPSFSSREIGRIAAVGQIFPQAVQLSWQPLVPVRKLRLRSPQTFDARPVNIGLYHVGRANAGALAAFDASVEKIGFGQ